MDTLNFKYSELIFSSTAFRKNIINIPTEAQKSVLEKCMVEFLQPLRDFYKKPIRINSGYRCPKLNKTIGGASKSDHQILDNLTCAVDLSCENNLELYKAILESKLPVHKLIWEFGDVTPAWIHVSWSLDPKKQNTRLMYKAVKTKNNKTKYIPLNLNY